MFELNIFYNIFLLQLEKRLISDWMLLPIISIPTAVRIPAGILFSNVIMYD